MRKTITILFALLILAPAIAMVTAPVSVSGADSPGKASQITTNPRYDRNPSIFRATDGTYWLFFARGKDLRGIRGLDGYNPDLDYYDIYYKTSKSIPGLEKASEKLLPGTPPDNAQRDIAALQTDDGKIWVFTSTGLGPGTERSIYYYTYDGNWQGPTSVPGTDYAAHIDALEGNGIISVFFDYGYTLKVVSYDVFAATWSDPVSIADHATIAKAIVDDGKFYVVWTYVDDVLGIWGSGIYLSTSTDGTNWVSKTEPIASWPGVGATNWDPVLIKDKGVFRLFWAPDAGLEGQFIATSASKNPTNTASWSAPVQITKASQGANNWWDFWPQLYTQGATYLLYSSERNSTGTGMTDSNIWMMHITVPLTR